MRIVLVLCCTAAIALAGCNPYSGPRTQPDEAVLTPQDLAAARRAGADVLAGTASGGRDRCAVADNALRQLQSLGEGLFRLPSAGIMEVDSRIWSRLPPPQQRSLLALLLEQARCAAAGTATAQRPVEAVVRDVRTKQALSRLRG